MIWHEDSNLVSQRNSLFIFLNQFSPENDLRKPHSHPQQGKNWDGTQHPWSLLHSNCLSGNSFRVLTARVLKGWRATLCYSWPFTRAGFSFHLDCHRGMKQCAFYCLWLLVLRLIVLLPVIIIGPCWNVPECATLYCSTVPINTVPSAHRRAPED